jgi:hypothetical protein
MEKQLDLGFCILIYSIGDKDINIEKKILTNAYNSNQEFAKIKIPKFNIQLVYSRKEFNKLWGSETQDFVSAFVKDDKIVIFAYSVFDKETTWKKKEFYNTLIHEINHLFYQELRDDEYDPLWLSEGLATFMQHHQRKSNHKIKFEITEKVLEQRFEEITIESYSVFGLFVEYLIINFGKDQLLELISGLKEGQKLNYLFQKIYKKSFIELINNANQYKKTT